MTMLLKVLNKVKFRWFIHQPKSFLIINLLVFAKLLDLLAINHSLTERRIYILPCAVCFKACMGAHFPAVELDNAIWFSTLSKMSGLLWVVPNGPVSLVVSFNIRQCSKCYHVPLTPTLTMWLLCSNCAHPCSNFMGVFSQRDTPAVLSPGPEALAKFSGKMHKYLRYIALGFWPFCAIIISLIHIAFSRI